MKTLYLQKCSITSSESLAEALASNKYLNELNISYNALGGDAIQHLANALRVNQGLKKLELDISGNALRNGSIQHIAHALQVNQHLKRLELANCSITDDGLCCLVKSIHNHCALNALLLQI